MQVALESFFSPEEYSLSSLFSEKGSHKEKVDLTAYDNK